MTGLASLPGRLPLISASADQFGSTHSGTCMERSSMLVARRFCNTRWNAFYHVANVSETKLVVANTFSAFSLMLSTPRSLVMRNWLLQVAIYVSISFIYLPSTWESPRLPQLLSWAGSALSVGTWKGQEARGQSRCVSLHWCWQHGLRLYQLTQVRKNKWN